MHNQWTKTCLIILLIIILSTFSWMRFWTKRRFISILIEFWIVITKFQIFVVINFTEIFVCIYFRQLPVYTKTANGATAIPLPATVLVTRRNLPDKVRPLPPTPNHQSCKLWVPFIIENCSILKINLFSLPPALSIQPSRKQLQEVHQMKIVDPIALPIITRKMESGNKFRRSETDLKLNQAWTIFIICFHDFEIQFLLNAI